MKIVVSCSPIMGEMLPVLRWGTLEIIEMHPNRGNLGMHTAFKSPRGWRVEDGGGGSQEPNEPTGSPWCMKRGTVIWHGAGYLSFFCRTHTFTVGCNLALNVFVFVAYQQGTVYPPFAIFTFKQCCRWMEDPGAGPACMGIHLAWWYS